MSNSQLLVSPLSGNTLLLKPGRLFDNNVAPQVVEVLASAPDNGYRWIIVDFADVEFLSSAGAGAIIGHIEMFRQADGDIVLCNVSRTILHVLRLLDLEDYLTFRKDISEASAACDARV